MISVGRRSSLNILVRQLLGQGRAEEAAIKSLTIPPKKDWGWTGAVPGMLSPVRYQQVIKGRSRGAPKAASFSLSSFD